MLRAVLFDMDGVLVDSEPFICEASVRMFREKGFHVKKEDFIPFVGSGENRYIGGVAEKHGIPLDLEKDKARTYEIYGELVQGRLIPLGGVHTFIEECRKRGLKLAVATSADKIKMEINLREIGIPVSVFDACITGLDVLNKKPFPDIYIEAARRLSVDPEECLVVEDAVNGVEAARRAGAKCLALTTSFSVDELKDAEWTCVDLSEAPLESLSW